MLLIWKQSHPCASSIISLLWAQCLGQGFLRPYIDWMNDQWTIRTRSSSKNICRTLPAEKTKEHSRVEAHSCPHIFDHTLQYILSVCLTMVAWSTFLWNLVQNFLRTPFFLPSLFFLFLLILCHWSVLYDHYLCMGFFLFFECYVIAIDLSVGYGLTIFLN